MTSENLGPLLQLLGEIGVRTAIPLYVVGGVVRDLLLGRPFIDNDIDVVAVGDAREVAREVALATGGTVTVHDRFLTAKVSWTDSASGQFPVTELDLVSARRESYPKPGALPTVKAGDLRDDLARRDFTINAMALPLEVLRSSGGLAAEAVVDFYGGRSDLEQRLLRVLHDQSFFDDPTRIVRGIRYKVRLCARWEIATAGYLAGALKAGAFSSISKQRLFRELMIAFDELNVAEILEELMLLEIVAIAGGDTEQVTRLATALRSVSLPPVGSVDRHAILLAGFFGIRKGAVGLPPEINIPKATRKRIVELSERANDGQYPWSCALGL